MTSKERRARIFEYMEEQLGKYQTMKRIQAGKKALNQAAGTGPAAQQLQAKPPGKPLGRPQGGPQGGQQPPGPMPR